MAEIRIYKHSSRRGATVIELMLSILLMLAFSVGGFDLGRGLWTYATVSLAARQGVRYAQTHGAYDEETGRGSKLSPGEVAEIVDQIVRNNAAELDLDKLEVITSWSPDNTPGSAVVVRAVYPYQSILYSLASKDEAIGLESEHRVTVTN